MEEQKHEKYVNPYTDFGFKKLFGTELNKDLLISLLNALFDRSAQQSPGEPKQVVKDFFKDRSVFYSAFPIIEQGKVGSDWDFHPNNVYTVGILNFISSVAYQSVSFVIEL